MKFGYQGAYHADNRAPGGQDLSYRFQNGVPNQLTENIRYYRTLSRVKYHAFFAQDSWTHNRLTLQGAVRYDHPWSEYPEQSVGGVTFLPAVTTFAASRGVQGYNDITPRLGAVYTSAERKNGDSTWPLSEAAVNGNGTIGAAAGVARARQRDPNLDRPERQFLAGLQSPGPERTDGHGGLLRPDQPTGVRPE